MARDGSSAGSRAAPGSARRSALIHCAMRSSPTSFWMPGCRCAMYKRPPPCGPADHDAAGREGGPRQPGPARHVCRRVHRGRSSVTRTGRQFHLAACGRAAWRPGRAMHHHGHAAVTGHSVKGAPEPLVGAAPRPQFRQAGGQQIRMFCAPAGCTGDRASQPFRRAGTGRCLLVLRVRRAGDGGRCLRRPAAGGR